MSDFSKESENQLDERFIVDNRALLRHFDLSRNKALRTLEMIGESISLVGNKPLDFFKTIISSVAPTIPLEVVVIYQDIRLPNHSSCKQGRDCLHHDSITETYFEAKKYKPQFGMFREMYGVRNFHLVLCLDVLECMAERAMQIFESVVKEEVAKGEFDYLSCEPLVVCERRLLRTRLGDTHVSHSGPVAFASVL